MKLNYGNGKQQSAASPQKSCSTKYAILLCVLIKQLGQVVKNHTMTIIS